MAKLPPALLGEVCMRLMRPLESRRSVFAWFRRQSPAAAKISRTSFFRFSLDLDRLLRTKNQNGRTPRELTKAHQLMLRIGYCRKMLALPPALLKATCARLANPRRFGTTRRAIYRWLIQQPGGASIACGTFDRFGSRFMRLVNSSAIKRERLITERFLVPLEQLARRGVRSIVFKLPPAVLDELCRRLYKTRGSIALVWQWLSTQPGVRIHRSGFYRFANSYRTAALSPMPQ
jgi:hypothetical protein